MATPRRIRTTGLLLAGLMLAGCQAAGPLATPTVATTAPTALPPATPLPTPAPAIRVAPTATPPSAVSLAREGDGWRFTAADGFLGNLVWVGTTRLLVNWSPAADMRPATTYLVNAVGGQFAPLAAVVPPGLVPAPGGTRAVLLQGRGQGAQSVGAALLQLPAGDLQTVFALDPAVPQWADAADRRWDFGNAPGSAGAAWVAPTLFVLTLTPEDDRNIAGWGKVLLVETAARRVRVLAERGQVLATLPDGGLLLRPGWVDGPLQILTPPYINPPAPVAPGGPWTWAATVSPDGGRVAWWELTPPPGDWSARLPAQCCSSDPAPLPRGLAIWDRAAGQVRRYPLPNGRWATDMRLRWRPDGTGLLYSAALPDENGNSVLFELGLDGRSIPLATPGGDGAISIEGEGADGSLYLHVEGSPSAGGNRLLRRYPDGRLDLLWKGTGMNYTTGAPGWSAVSQDGATTLWNLTDGSHYWVDLPGAVPAPAGHWAAVRATDTAVRLVPLR